MLVVLSEQAQIVGEQSVTGAPALVVETLSPGTRRRDQGIKQAHLTDEQRRGAGCIGGRMRL